MADLEREKIRTMKTDIEELMKKEGGSSFLGAVARGMDARYEQGYAPPKRNSGRRFAILASASIFLFLIAGGTAYLYFFRDATQENQPPPFTIPRGFVPADITDKLEVRPNDRTGIIESLKAKERTRVGDSIAYVPFIVSDITVSKRTGTVKEFFEFLRATPPPADLLASITDRWNIYLVYGKPVLIFEANDYSKLFGASLQWEQSLIQTMLLVMQEEVPPGDYRFEDKLIKNNHVRIAKLSPSEDIVVAHSVVLQKYLIVTTSEQALRDMLDRFIAGSIVN